MEKYMPNDINDDYQFIRNLRESKNSKDYDLWETRLFSWVKKLTTNDEVDPEKLAKFRSVSALLSEVPRNPYINSKILSSFLSSFEPSIDGKHSNLTEPWIF